jgi:hypothetical protein
MMARRTGGPGITLFSFQDIITSVSGIMIFVTLILALELSQKTQTGRAVVRDAADLQARITAAKAERDTLKQRAMTATRSAGRSSLADARAAHEAANRVEEAERELAALERRAGAANARKEDAKIRKSGVEATTEEAFRRKKAEVESLRQKLQDARNGDRVYFNIDADPSARREGWIALVDGRTVTVAPFGRPQRPRTFDGDPGEPGELDQAARAFVDWAGSEARGAYILLVARPSGLERIGPIEDAFSAARRPFGLDLVTESQEVLDPENGIYRP